jgi:hypothetical protein
MLTVAGMPRRKRCQRAWEASKTGPCGRISVGLMAHLALDGGRGAVSHRPPIHAAAGLFAKARQ